MPRRAVTQSPKISEEEAVICQRVRQSRLESGLSQMRAATEIGVSFNTLKAYEYAKLPIRFGFAIRFCEALDVNPIWLATGNRPRSPYFPISQELFDAIPAQSLFSVVYQRILGEVLQDYLQEHIRNGWSLSSIESRFDPSKSRKVGPGLHDIQQSITEGFNERLSSILFNLPPRLLEKFVCKISSEIDQFLSVHNLEFSKLEPGFMAKGPHSHFRAELHERILNFVRFQLGLSSLTPKENLVQIQKSLSRIAEYSDGVEIAAQEREIELTPSTASRSPVVRNENPTTEMPTNDIAQRITSARKLAKLSQVEAAKEWGVSLGSLRDWEQSRSQPRGLYRERIEAILAKIEQRPGKGQ